jgi:hypothetical protein
MSSFAAPNARAIHRLTWMLRVGIAMATLGFVWNVWPLQEADAWFRPVVSTPAFSASPYPRIVFDEGHYNVHTSTGRYRPFVQLLARDGFLVMPSEGRITPEALRSGDIFVTANPLGFNGLVQHLLNFGPFERAIQLPVDAFADEEIRVLSDWVARGGAALIVGDHAPAGKAARRLAAAFGVEMTDWWVEDPVQHDQSSGNIAALVFSRENRLLGDHPVLHGRGETERVDLVMTFTGQALKAPPHGDVLLRLSATARQYPFRPTPFARGLEALKFADEGQSAAGLAQAVAIRHGRGRVIVMGEAAALSAQLIEVPDGPPIAIGMNREGTDNQQFVLNAMRWLAGVM